MGLAEDSTFLNDILRETTYKCTQATDQTDWRPKHGHPCSNLDCTTRIRGPFDSFVLQEGGDDATLRNVPLDGVSASGIVLKPDSFCITFFKSKLGLNKACDYLVLTEHKNTKYAIFIELKSSIYNDPDTKGNLRLLENKDILTACQLNSTSALFDYLCAVEKRVNKTTSLFGYSRHFAVLYDEVLRGTHKPIPTMTGKSATKSLDPTTFSHKEIKAIKAENNKRISIESLLSY